jgi:hypothetical protein
MVDSRRNLNKRLKDLDEQETAVGVKKPIITGYSGHDTAHGGSSPSDASVNGNKGRVDIKKNIFFLILKY